MKCNDCIHITPNGICELFWLTVRGQDSCQYFNMLRAEVLERTQHQCPVLQQISTEIDEQSVQCSIELPLPII